MNTKIVYMVRYKTFKNGKTTKGEIYEKEETPEFLERMKKVFPGIIRKVFNTKAEAKDFAKGLEDANNKLVPEVPKISSEIKKIINSLFEIQKAKVLANLRVQYKRAVDKLKTVEGMDYKSKEWIDVISFEFRGQTNQTFCGLIYWKLMDQMSESFNKYSYTFKPDYKKILEKMIKDDLEGILASFLHKMEFKLGGIIKEKEIEKFISEGLHDGFVSFKFKDGTYFEMKNTIEWGTSKLGVSFQRFPCRFHDVKFSDGQLIKWASEEEMKEKF
jgi:hypothetical protein